MTAHDSESLLHQYADVTGHIKTTYRDKGGHKIDPKLQREKKERLKQEDGKFILWGRG